MEGMSGSEWLANALASAGVRDVFFIDSVLRRTLIALEGVGIRRHLAHTEKGVVYMADGYARVAGTPALCFAQSVGAANMAAALQDAYLARVPVLAMTGRKPAGMAHANAYQEVPHGPLFAPVTKFSADVPRAEDMPRLLRAALRAATTGTPRPAHLDLGGLSAEIFELGRIAEPAMLSQELLRLPPHRPVADADEIAAAATVLLAARRLVIVAGDAALQSGAGDEVLALAELLGAPVATTLGARALIPTRHRLCVGEAGSYAAPPANQVVHAAECVLFVGCDTGDQVTHGWRIPAAGTRIVQVELDPEEIGRNYAGTLGGCGDPKMTLAALRAAIGPAAARTEFADWAAGLMEAWRAAMAPARGSEASPIRVERLCAEIERALPADGILVADTGYSGIWTGTCVELSRGQQFLRAAGSLGWSFPAALGAKLAAGERKVICFSGDGTFYYHLAELETARRRGIATVTVINNNSGFGQGWPGLLRMQGNTPGHPEELLRFGPTDFAAVARSFGVEGIRVTEPGEIAPALARALSMDAPVVVDVVTDIDQRAPAPWLPEGV